MDCAHTFHSFPRKLQLYTTHNQCREHSIFQDGGAPSDSKPLEGILSFGKGIKQADPFDNGDSYDDD